MCKTSEAQTYAPRLGSNHHLGSMGWARGVSGLTENRSSMVLNARQSKLSSVLRLGIVHVELVHISETWRIDPERAGLDAERSSTELLQKSQPDGAPGGLSW